jgi:cytochrome c553
MARLTRAIFISGRQNETRGTCMEGFVPFSRGEQMRASHIAAACGLLAALTAPAHAQTADDDARAARYLAANCANCHGTTGRAVGPMPSLAGQPRSFIVEQMAAFRDGKRPATIMHQLSRGYTDRQIELIADHFSRQKPAR